MNNPITEKPFPTEEDLIDAKEDLNSLSEVVNGDPETTVTTRLGCQIPSVKKIIAEIQEEGQGWLAKAQQSAETAAELAEKMQKLLEEGNELKESVAMALENQVFFNNDQLVDQNNQPIQVAAHWLDGHTLEELKAGPLGDVTLRCKSLLDTAEGGVSDGWCWAVTENNELIFWGKESLPSGVSGSDSSSPSTSGAVWRVPQPIEKKDIPIKKIAACYKTGYVLYGDGELYGMGDNYYGQVRQIDPNSEKDPFPEVETKLTLITDGVIQFATLKPLFPGSIRTLAAIKEDGFVWTWGDNKYHQCGRNPEGWDTIRSPGKSDLDLYQNEKATQIYVVGAYESDNAGGVSTFVVTDQGRLFACGSGKFGALGLGNPSEKTVVFEPVGKIGKVKELAPCTQLFKYSGETRYETAVAALTTQGEIFLWGGQTSPFVLSPQIPSPSTPHKDNTESEPRESSIPSNTVKKDNTELEPKKLPSLSNITKIVGAFNTLTWLALDAKGTCWGFGPNIHQCLGTGSGDATDKKVAPVNINDRFSIDSSSVQDMLITPSNTLFIRTKDGRLFSTGNAQHGECGTDKENQNYAEDSDNLPAEIPLGRIGEIQQWSFTHQKEGGTTLFLLLKDGRLLSWGDNSKRQATLRSTNSVIPSPQLALY